MISNDSVELETFKRHPIADLLPHFGFSQPDPKTPEFVSPSGGKLKIFRSKTSGDWLWKSFDGSITVRGRDSGTIIDIATMTAGSLGDARKILRSITGSSVPSPTTAAARSSAPPHSAAASAPETAAEASAHFLSHSSPDSAPIRPYASEEEVLSEYRRGTEAWHPGQPLPDYLTARGFTDLPAIFDNTFRIGMPHYTHRNVLFPYYCVDEESCMALGGVESKNTGYRSYTKGGRAGIWIAADHSRPIRVVVVTESPIDAMAYAVLTGIDAQCYIALRSGSEDLCAEELLRLARNGLEAVVVATDNDPAGMLYAHKIMLACRKGGFDRVRYHAPQLFDVDWTESLERRAAKRREEQPANRHPAEISTSTEFDMAI